VIFISFAVNARFDLTAWILGETHFLKIGHEKIDAGVKQNGSSTKACTVPGWNQIAVCREV
jgi:hypothetical protein